MAESEKLRGYKKNMRAVFSRSTRNGFVDWRHLDYLYDEIIQLMNDALQDFSLPLEWRELLNFTFATCIKWANTPMQENGETMDFVYRTMEIWEETYQSMPDEEEKKMLDFFLTRLDGRMADYVEERVYDFVIGHFKSPSLLAIKRKFIESKLSVLEETEKDGHCSEYPIYAHKNYMLQILSDEGAPIEDIEAYAQGYGGNHGKLLLKIYRERGEREREMKLLQEVIADRYIWDHENWENKKRLKELYHESGMTEEYDGLLETMFYEYPGDKGIYHEYRSRFTDKEWEAELEIILDRLRGHWNAMPFFVLEKQYDCLMETAEKIHDFGNCEKLLNELYPDRSLGVYVSQALIAMGEADNRNGYRRVKRILKGMRNYPNGPETASKLAAKFRETYPRRTALLDELKGF